MTLEERNEFIVKNLNLTRWGSDRYTKAVIKLEDMEAIAALVLVRAADGYDPSKGAFTTYYHRAAWRAFNQCKLRGKELSLDAPFKNNDDGFSLYELLDSNELPVGEAAWFWYDFERAVAKLPKKHLESIGLFLRGKSFADIARIQGISRQGATQKMRSLLAEIRRSMCGWERSCLF